MDEIINKYILLSSGIGNQLIPLISIIRICDKFNYKLYVKLNKIQAYNFSKIDNFTFNLNNLIEINYDISFIDSIPNNCINCNCNWGIKNNVITSNEKNNIFYYNVCHLFGCVDDNIQNYRPTPCKKLELNTYINELKKYSRLITPIKIIKDKVDNYINKLDCKVLGLHIRKLDGGFIEMYNESRLLNYINKFIDNNKDWKIYISADNINIENKLINKYKEHIIKLDEPFGNKYTDKFANNNFGLMNSMYEIFILSKCNNFVGSAGSTFSFLAWLLSTNDSLEFWNEQ